MNPLFFFIWYENDYPSKWNNASDDDEDATLVTDNFRLLFAENRILIIYDLIL